MGERERRSTGTWDELRWEWKEAGCEGKEVGCEKEISEERQRRESAVCGRRLPADGVAVVGWILLKFHGSGSGDDLAAPRIADAVKDFRVLRYVCC